MITKQHLNKPITFLLLLVLAVTFILSGCKNDSNDAKKSPLILISQKNENANNISMVDFITLKDLKEKKPVEIGENYKAAISEDGSIVTAMSQSGSKNSKLVVVKTAKWKKSEKTLDFKKVANRLFVSKNNQTIYWIRLRTDKKDSRDSILQSYDLKTTKVKTLYSFKSGFVPDKVHVSSDGKSVIVYGLNVNSELLAKGAPVLYLIDLKKGSVRSKTILDGVMAGLKVVEKPLNGKEYFESYSPGLTSSKDQQKLFITQPSTDKVMVVNLKSGKILENAKVKNKVSLLDFFVATANAETNVVPTGSQAVVSDDGNTLYVIELGYERKSSSGRNIFKQTFSGLKVIDTSDMTKIATSKINVSAVNLINDGKWLLLSGAFDLFKRAKNNGGLYIYNTDDLKVDKFVLDGAKITYLGSFADEESDYAYVKYILGMGGHGAKSILTAVDLSSKKVVKRRTLKGYVCELLTVK